jgi:hypothetical protein
MNVMKANASATRAQTTRPITATALILVGAAVRRDSETTLTTVAGTDHGFCHRRRRRLQSVAIG